MDLHTIAQEEQQLRGERKAAVSGHAIARASLDKHSAEIVRIDRRLDELEAETRAVFSRARGAGLEETPEAPPVESLFGEPEAVAAE
jgi:hypothetical protein